MIDARRLHEELGTREQFNQWIRRRVDEYGFEEGSDFWCCLTKTRGRPRQDYLLTLDMAKELSMVERTERGRQVRRYFIGMEKAAREMAERQLAEGRPEAIPQSFFEAQAELLGRVEERLHWQRSRHILPTAPDGRKTRRGFQR